jgi:hypothetical protein
MPRRISVCPSASQIRALPETGIIATAPAGQRLPMAMAHVRRFPLPLRSGTP